MTAGIVTLASGRSRLRLWPEVGGAIVDWTVDDLPLLRPAPPEALAARNSQRLASYPLVPYSNRIADARFTFGGETFQLARNYLPHPHAIHGVGWRRPWTLEHYDATSASLTLTHDPARDGADAWPFAFDARQRFTCADDGIDVAMRIDNRDRRPMPAGLGHHPYFPRSPQVELQFEAAAVWLNEPDLLPREQVAVPPQWDFARRRPLGAPGLDNCFADWSGAARIVWPEHRLGLAIDADAAFRHLVVFTPAGDDFFAIEPVSHRNNGLNHPMSERGHGVVVLQPGEHLAGSIRMRVERE